MEKPKVSASFRFNGETGEVIESHNCTVEILKIGIGDYIINPSDEEKAEHYRKDHLTKETPK